MRASLYYHTRTCQGIGSLSYVVINAVLKFRDFNYRKSLKVNNNLPIEIITLQDHCETINTQWCAPSVERIVLISVKFSQIPFAMEKYGVFTSF